MKDFLGVLGTLFSALALGCMLSAQLALYPLRLSLIYALVSSVVALVLLLVRATMWRGYTRGMLLVGCAMLCFLIFNIVQRLSF